MAVVRPDFYDRFVCRAADCRHSCCRGWEIDVDGETAARYDALPGPLGEALREAMYEDGEGRHFRLTGEGRCPLLRPDGLCRVILEAGEDALCDICALHPRFFGEVRGAELWGLGLSCEAVCALLLEAPELRFLTDEGEDLSLEGLLLRLGLHLTEERLHFRPARSEEYYVNLLGRYAACEPIDGAWTAELEELRAALPELLPRLALETEGSERSLDSLRSLGMTDGDGFCAGVWDRIYGYILYRQLERAAETPVGVLADYARDACGFLLLSTLHRGDLPEQVRRWSEEIEYSTENVALLLCENL